MIFVKNKEYFLAHFFLFQNSTNLLMKNLESLNYAKFPNIVTFYLDVNWSNFEDYVEKPKTGKTKDR